MVASIDAELAVTRMRLNNIGQVVRRRSPRGTARAAANPSCSTYPMLDGGPNSDWDTDYRYDPNGWKTQSIDPLGNTSTFTYDRAGNQTASSTPGAKAQPTDSAPTPQVTSTTYDARDLTWASTVGAAGGASVNKSVTTVNEYDGNGNLRRTVKPSGLSGGVPVKNDAAPQTTTPAVDAGNQAVNEATWHAEVREYNDADQLTSVLSPWGAATYATPPASFPAADQSSRRFRQDFERDARGYITADRRNYEWPANPPVCAAPPAVQSNQSGVSCIPRSTYTRFDNGWVRSSTDPDATDASGAGKHAYGERQLYDYDRRGLQTSWKTKANRSATDDGEGGPFARETTRDYYPSGKVRQRTATPFSPGPTPSSRIWGYGYDQNRQLTSITDNQNPGPYAMSYDRAGRQISYGEQWGTGNRDTVTTYDEAGNRLSQKTDGQISGSSYTGGKETTSTWDHRDQEDLTTVSLAGSPTQRWQRSYYPSGQPASTTESQQTGIAQPVVRLTESWHYRNDGQAVLNNRVDANGQSVMEGGQATTYAYDADVNRTGDENGTYAYNAMGQLSSWVYPQYDTSGLRTSQTGSKQYVLDGQGNIQSELDSARGATGGLPSTSYTYVGDRLVGTTERGTPFAENTVYDYSTESGANPSAITERGTKTTYSYDAYNRAIGTIPATRNASNQWVDGNKTTTTYDTFDRRTKQTTPGQTDSTFSYSGSTQDLSAQVRGGQERRFDFSGDSEPLGMRDATTPSAEYKSFGLSVDGSIQSLEGNAGTSGMDAGKSNRYRYDPYGAAVTGLAQSTTPSGSDLENELSPGAQGNPLRFQGFQYDAALKTYDMHSRAYRPTVGRFQTADRYESSAKDFNLEADPVTQSRYAWAGGNPIGNVEYDGHDPHAADDEAREHGDTEKGAEVSAEQSENSQADNAEQEYQAEQEGARARQSQALEQQAREEEAQRQAAAEQEEEDDDDDGGLKGFVNGAVGAGKETVNAATHPEQTAKGLGHAVTHPAETISTVAHSCDGRSVTNCVGYAGTSLVGAKGATKAASIASKAGKVGEVERAVPGCASFSGDTQVVMADGTRKALSDLKPGEWVLATDPVTGQSGPRQVDDVWVHDDVLVDLLAGGARLTTTAKHPFWDADKQRWSLAGALTSVSKLTSATGAVVSVEHLIDGSERTGRAYNLTVAGLHTYYVVTGWTTALVHNCSRLSGDEQLDRMKAHNAGRQPGGFAPVDQQIRDNIRSTMDRRRGDGKAYESGQHGEGNKAAARDLDQTANNDVLLDTTRDAYRKKAKELRARAKGTSHPGGSGTGRGGR